MPILVETFPGAPGGMVLAFPAQELDDTEVRYLQDGLVDFPGLTRRRGPVRGVANIAALPRKATGLLVTLTPQGEDRYAALTGNATNGFFTIYSPDLQAVVDLAWPHPLPADPAAGAATSYRIHDAKAALEGGLWVGVSSAYDSDAPNQGLALWKGGTKANYTTGTISVARGSAAVTGVGTAWLANAEPGMFLFANTDEGYSNTLIGSVLTVNSDTSITLEAVSPYAVTADPYTLQSLRGFAPKVTTGRITAATDSTKVSGGNTKFLSQIGSTLVAANWSIYRQRDFAFVGRVDTVNSDISITLVANATIAVADEAYVAIRHDSDWSIETTANVNKVGFLTATYAERQWYANNGATFDKTHRLWFSATSDPEAVDLTDDGDWIPVSSTRQMQEPLRAIAPAYNALLVMKENETFALHGASPSTFSVRKLEDDGALSGMSVQLYGGGVLWAGREGIHYYDGITTTNLMQNKFGDVWKNSLNSFDPARFRMWSMIARNHYILHIEDLDPTVSVTKGNVSTQPTRWTVVINMVTRAVTMMTNVNLRGAVQLPASMGEQVWYLVNDATKGVICSADALFDEEGVDPVVADGGTAGPDFYLESKKFDAGDGLRLKRFKQLAIHYLAQGDTIRVDTVTGLNEVGQTMTTEFPNSVYTWSTLRTAILTWTGVKNQFATWANVVSSVFVPKRAKFQKGSTHLAFRLYQKSAAITRLKLGPFQIGYKLKRAGRVS